jgi:hypothetical protein
MEKETIKKIFDFLEDNEGKRSVLWKLVNDEPLKDEELKVDGYLNLSETDIESLPKGLRVGDDLYIQYTKITSLPEGLQVGGNLHIYNTKLAKFSDNEIFEMIKPGFIEGKIER